MESLVYSTTSSAIPRWQLAVLVAAMLPGVGFVWQLASAAFGGSLAGTTELHVAAPSVLFIPSLGIEAPVVGVGTKPNGDMDIPADSHTIGWFEHGTYPGSTGSMVMTGHLDGPQGEPAVLWDLSRLKTGERIIVKDAMGKGHVYVVEASESYETDAAPIERIFTQSDRPRLNLITCSGQWDPSAWSYDHRLVVYAVLEES